MKNINLEFNRMPENIPIEIIEEKQDNLKSMLYYFYSKALILTKKVMTTRKMKS